MRDLFKDLYKEKEKDKDKTQMQELINDMTESESDLDAKDYVDENRSNIVQNAIKGVGTARLKQKQMLRSEGIMYPDKLHSSHNFENLDDFYRKQSVYDFQSNLISNIDQSSMQFNAKNLLGLRKRKNTLTQKRVKTAQSVRPNNSNPPETQFMSYKELLNDQRSMRVFSSNQAKASSNTQNRFSHNDTWNQTYNCPYYGLIAIRRRQELSINSEARNENILRSFTLGNKRERQRYRKLERRIKNKNTMIRDDKKIYDLIEKCVDSSRIKWNHIYKENDDFRIKQ